MGSIVQKKQRKKYLIQKKESILQKKLRKISDAHKGENNPNYKDGNSLKEFKDTHDMEPEEWKNLAQEIRKRDNFICQYCGKKDATDVHHIIPRRIKIDNSPDNLITLCRSCHIKIERLTDKYLAEGKDPREIFYKKWQE
jgi:5-methylcytosine-specific restriction endonuclease McrA